MDEVADYNRSAEPGTWPHFVSVIRPWLAFLSRYEPAA